MFTKVLIFIYSNYFIAQLGILLTRISTKVKLTVLIFFMGQNDTYPKYKDFLVVMVMVKQIAYNLVGSILFIQT